LWRFYQLLANKKIAKKVEKRRRRRRRRKAIKARLLQPKKNVITAIDYGSIIWNQLFFTKRKQKTFIESNLSS
jgi:hypothetical protein